LIAILALEACSSVGKATRCRTAPEVEMTNAEMEALISEKIEENCPLEYILQQEKSAEEWSET